MNKKDKLIEATMLAMRGKLNEVYVKDNIVSFEDLYDNSWGQALDVLDDISNADLREEFMDYIEEYFAIQNEGDENNPVGKNELNDYIAYEWKEIYKKLGLDENGKLKSDELDEAKNPDNEKINDKIRKSLNGSTKYKDDLKDAGLETVEDEKGKVTKISNSNGRSMNKQDLKNSHPDTDYYNYLTKDKVAPEVTDTGAFEVMNAFRNSDNFTPTISGSDRRVFSTDKNGVSNAIPKKYKTGRKNYNIDFDKFPRKSYQGVASYEPISNKELNAFKYAKQTTGEDGWRKADLDKAKAEYDRAKAEYDKYDNTVKDVRDRIAKSKENTNNKKVTEATTDVNEVYEEYKEAYNKELDLKTVPCVIARDKWLSGWGQAEGRNHYQVVLCGDSTEAYNIASNMKAKAESEQLANIRVNFGVRTPRGASVSYRAGRNARAWNMGDSWYEKYNNAEEITNKKEESKLVEDSDIENIADTFKYYNAFRNNFGDIVIVKSKYNNLYYFYRNEEDAKAGENYFNYAPNADFVEGWLYGAVQANNKVVIPINRI